MERLKEYRSKRDFRRTPEPDGSAPTVTPATGPGRRFVIHKHAASRLHYDLRLETEGVLRSWALPKGPSLAPGEKRLAIEVEDHPLEYADFEGVIPKPDYGGGTVMLWDRGRWRELVARDDRLDFELAGAKLRGRWTLTRSRGADGDERHWLMIRRRTGAGEATATVGPPADDDRSVLTDRTMAEIARDADRVWTAGGEEPARSRTPPHPSQARPAALDEAVEVQLATLVEAPPEGDEWLHEIKFDGYRVAAVVRGGDVRLLTRNGHDWTERFPTIAASLARLRAEEAVIDGEVVSIDRDGVSRFGALQAALSAGATAGLRYQAFDLLRLDGHDLRAAPQRERKAALAELLHDAGGDLGAAVGFTDHVVGRGPDFYRHACRLGLEGIISKRRDAPYRGGRSRAWLKVKCLRRGAFVVGGFTEPRGSRRGVGALLLGAHDDAGLVYVGRVGTGFDDRTLERLHGLLRGLHVATSPFVSDVPDTASVTWTEPKLVVEVAYAELTRDGRLRHATFAGVRRDVLPRDVRLAPPEEDVGGAAPVASAPTPEPAPAATPPKRRAPKPSRGGRRGDDDAEVAGVRLSNAHRVLFPEQGVTKLALARYYERVQDHVLPEVAGRPLALLRCPQGHEEGCFFQKHPGDAFPKSLPRLEIAGKEGKGVYAYVESLADLVALVQAGVLEVHVWGSRVADLERPDRMVLDLDPSPDVPWARTRAEAVALRERLASHDLHGFLRTTGGKGLHVVVPLQPAQGWDEVKAFARALCEAHAADDPERLTTSMSFAKRGGKIFLDYLRNGRGATAIASYSTRARAGAPVAVPVRWDELGPSLRSDRYHVGNVPRRLASLRSDPWAGFDAAARPLPKAASSRRRRR